MNYRYVVFAYAVSLLCLPVILRAAQAELSPMDKKIEKQMSKIAKSSKNITFDGKTLKVVSRPSGLDCTLSGGLAAFSTWLAVYSKLPSFNISIFGMPLIEETYNPVLCGAAVVVDALCAYMLYKRFNPDVSLALTKKKIAIPGRSNVHWRDVKQLGVKNTTQKNGYHGYKHEVTPGHYSTYKQAEYTTKTHINMTLKNDNKVQIDTAVLPIHYDSVYNLMSDLVTHNA